MNSIKDWASGKKAYITAVMGILAAIAGYLTGELGVAEALGAVWIAIQAMTLRAGIAKAEK